MAKRRLLLTTILVAVVLAAQGQPAISFSSAEVHLGEVLWKKPVTVTFPFTNSGSETLRVSHVEAGCGCLSPTWTAGGVAPGESGTVSVVYDAALLGHFDKELAVYVESSPTPAYLSLRGVVRAKITNYSDLYPIQIGSLFVDTNAIDFGDVNSGEQRVAEIEIYNASGSAYEPVLMHLPPYLEAKATPELLTSDRAGKILLTLHTERLSDLGLNETSVYVARFPGDKVGSENEIKVQTVLLPDFSHLTMAGLAAAPAVSLSADEVHLTLGTKKRVSQTLYVTNNGKSDLEFKMLQVTDSSVNVSLKKSVVRPGESVKMVVTAVAKYFTKEEKQLRILVITNDPSHPKAEVNVTLHP